MKQINQTNSPQQFRAQKVFVSQFHMWESEFMFGVNAISYQSVANRQSPISAVYALRITLYDTNLFVADATPTEAFPSPQNRVFIKSCLA